MVVRAYIKCNKNHEALRSRAAVETNSRTCKALRFTRKYVAVSRPLHISLKYFIYYLDIFCIYLTVSLCFSVCDCAQQVWSTGQRPAPPPEISTFPSHLWNCPLKVTWFSTAATAVKACWFPDHRDQHTLGLCHSQTSSGGVTEKTVLKEMLVRACKHTLWFRWSAILRKVVFCNETLLHYTAPKKKNLGDMESLLLYQKVIMLASLTLMRTEQKTQRTKQQQSNLIV